MVRVGSAAALDRARKRPGRGGASGALGVARAPAGGHRGGGGWPPGAPAGGHWVRARAAERGVLRSAILVGPQAAFCSAVATSSSEVISGPLRSSKSRCSHASCDASQVSACMLVSLYSVFFTGGSLHLTL